MPCEAPSEPRSTLLSGEISSAAKTFGFTRGGANRARRPGACGWRDRHFPFPLEGEWRAFSFFEVREEFAHAPRGKRERSPELEIPLQEPRSYFLQSDSRVQTESDETGSGLGLPSWGARTMQRPTLTLDLTPQFVMKGEPDGCMMATIGGCRTEISKHELLLRMIR